MCGKVRGRRANNVGSLAIRRETRCVRAGIARGRQLQWHVLSVSPETTAVNRAVIPASKAAAGITGRARKVTAKAILAIGSRYVGNDVVTQPKGEGLT